MAGIDLQSVDRFVSDSALIPATCQSVVSGSSNPPKFGTLIPNRIFVGGIPSNTTEQELKNFFSSFGQVKDVKIISDRLGVSKGSYGFVTFESQEMAEKIIKNEAETLIFKDRKLNIGHAIRKQQMFPRTDLPAALFFAGGAMPYGFQNGMALLSIPGQEYPVLTQTTAPYATMMLPQAGGAPALYLPSSLHSTAANSPYAALSQQQLAAATLQQQLPTGGTAVGLNPAVASQLNSAAVSAANLGTQSNSTATVMAAAAAAMAAAVQWPQQTISGQQSHQLTNVSGSGVPHSSPAPHSVVQGNSLTAQQAAAVAAAMAAQQAGWRWSPIQTQTQLGPHANTVSTHASNSNTPITATSSLSNNNTSTPTISNTNLHGSQQQGSPTAALGPATYLYSPIAGTGHELMFFHQTSSPFTANSTSDYSTDHSAQSSGLLESGEPLSFPGDGTPLGRHSQHLGHLTNSLGNHLDPNSLSSYAAFAPVLDLQGHSSASGPQSAIIHPTNLHQQFRQQQQQLTAQHAASAHQFVPIAHAATTLLPSQPTKLYSPSVLTGVSLSGSSLGGMSGSLHSTLFGTAVPKSNSHTDITSSEPNESVVLSQQSGQQNSGTTISTPAATNTGTGHCNVLNVSNETNAVGVGVLHR